MYMCTYGARTVLCGMPHWHMPHRRLPSEVAHGLSTYLGRNLDMYVQYKCVSLALNISTLILISGRRAGVPIPARNCCVADETRPAFGQPLIFSSKQCLEGALGSWTTARSPAHAVSHQGSRHFSGQWCSATGTALLTETPSWSRIARQRVLVDPFKAGVVLELPSMNGDQTVDAL